VAGPHHPAFGEMVRSRLFFRRVRKALAAARNSGPKVLRLAAADRSIFAGQKNYYLHRLTALGLLDGVKLEFSSSGTRADFTLLDSKGARNS